MLIRRARSVYSIGMSIARVVTPFALTVVLVAPALADVLPAAAARVRVEHHLQYVERLSTHFESMLTGSCPRFPSREAWDAYVEAESDRLVLLLAHLEQA